MSIYLSIYLPIYISIYTYIDIYDIQVHLSKLECRGKVHLFQ